MNPLAIELRHLRYFVAVGEELHFGRAAKRLHLAQPPLSQQIRRLEEEVGYPLLTRSSRSVKLTPAGQVLLERAQRLLGRVAEDVEAVRSVARGEEGVLSIGFIGSAMLTNLPDLLRRYRSLYPRVQLKLSEFHTSRLVEALREGSADVALLRDCGIEPALHIEPVVQEPFVAVIPKRHGLARLRRLPVTRLASEPFVLFSRSSGSQAWEKTMRVCERAGFHPQIVQEAPHWLTILRLVGAGLGVSIAPASVEKIAPSDVVCRRLSPGGETTSIELGYRVDPMSPLVAAFAELVRGRLRAGA